jgi:NifB/MoaA-like Fe-S oxidoreductase
VIKNYFYGESITVSGLLTGKDIFEQLSGKDLGDELFIPENCLKDGEDVFLCGMTVEELSSSLGVKITLSENDGYEFVRALLGVE